MEFKEELENLLDGVIGAVEANSYEYHSLWMEYSEEADRAFKVYPNYVKYKWVSNSCGLDYQVGEISKRPVFVSLRTAVINGHKILFYDPTSELVDWKMVEEWLKSNLPKTAFREDGYLNKTGAMNFSNIFPRKVLT